MTREEKINMLIEENGYSRELEQLKHQKYIDVDHLENYYFRDWWRKKEELKNTKKYEKKYKELDKYSSHGPKNINEYIDYFKKWKSFIKLMINLSDLPEDEVDKAIFESMDMNTFRYCADEASERYEMFTKKYKTYKKHLKENRLTNIDKLIDKAYEYAKKYN